MTDAPAISRRDQIRNAVASAKPKSKEIDFFGTKIEVRQPRMALITANTDNDDETVGGQTIRLILNCCFVPGTDELVFEASDADMILQLPFGDEMKNLTDALNAMTNVKPAEAAKSAEA